nr:MFS transporter [Candidatus Liberibacter americanus]
MEHSIDKKNLGFLGSMKAFSGALGSILCVIVIYICQKLTGDNYNIWGWRLTYYFCFIMGIIGFSTRYMTEETVAYKLQDKNNNLSLTPFLELISDYKKVFMIGIGLGMAQNAIVYSVLMFYNMSLKELIVSGIDIRNVIRIVVEIVFASSAVIFAILSDRIGRKNIMVPVLLFFSFISLPILSLLSSEIQYVVVFSYLLLSIPLGASFGIYNSIVCELFPTKVRCIGLSLAHNISAGILGGISPAICTWLIKKSGTNIAAGFYLTTCALISLICMLQIRKKDSKIDW